MTSRQDRPTMPANVFAVILAGGSGTRFWPKSRLRSPKQLCKIGDPDKTMLELTLDRLERMIPPERRIIVTHEQQAQLTAEIIDSRVARILKEPQARNTAAALCLAALEVEKMNSSAEPAIMISLHADHVIQNLEGFENTLNTAIKLAQQDFLTLIGIRPDRPETGFGYIERGQKLGDKQTHLGFTVKSFREKPDQPQAKLFVESGDFYWNSGLFIWKTAVILRELQHHLPQTFEPLSRLSSNQRSFSDCLPGELAETYASLPKISIDHAIFEKSAAVAVVEAQFGWLDVGSWDAVEQCASVDVNGNVALGDVIFEDSFGCTIDTDGPLIAVIGMRDVVAVHAKGAILICPKARAQEVKKIVERLEASGRHELL